MILFFIRFSILLNLWRPSPCPPSLIECFTNNSPHIVVICPLHLFSKCNVSRASLFPSCLLASCPLASNLQIIFFTLSWYHFLSHSFIWRPLISEIFALTMIKKQKSKVYQSKVLVACQNMSNKWHLRELKCKQIICKLWRYSLFYRTLKGKGA